MQGGGGSYLLITMGKPPQSLFCVVKRVHSLLQQRPAPPINWMVNSSTGTSASNSPNVRLCKELMGISWEVTEMHARAALTARERRKGEELLTGQRFTAKGY
jgi:hypothetical protein